MTALGNDTSIVQLKVTLKRSKPPIWRRVQVRAGTTLGMLHDIIQIAMGWTDSHLHQFTVDGQRVGRSIPEFDFDMDREEDDVHLNDVIQGEKDKFEYIYDFGDRWVHVILVERVMQAEPGTSYPRCVKGRRNCPPEDIGGTWGYDGFLKAIQDEDDPRHEEYKSWIGGDFDPEAFDAAEVNQVLKEEIA